MRASWATIPPTKVAMGERSPEDTAAKTLSTSSSSSCFWNPPLDCWLREAFISWQILTKSSWSDVLPGLGIAPFLLTNSSSAEKATCSKAGLSSLAKSQRRKSPGSAMQSASGLNDNVLGSLTLVTRPPEMYFFKFVVSSSSSKE